MHRDYQTRHGHLDRPVVLWGVRELHSGGVGSSAELRYKHPMLGLVIITLLAGFDPSAATRLLEHPEERTATLRTLGSLKAPARAAAREAGLGQRVTALATDPTQRFEDRVLAIRAAARIGGEHVQGPLRILTQGSHDGVATAIAREAARALYQLGALKSLDSARLSVDPEVRAYAARAGGGVALCILLADPWPMVRAAAAVGLGKSPSAPKCLARALEHEHPRVRYNAARSAQLAPHPSLRGPLRALAGDARAPVDARAEAFVGLAHLGDLEPAKRALATHLEKGGIVPLALAALRAFAVNDAHLDVIRSGLTSGTDTVRVAAAKLLVARDDLGSRDAIAETSKSVAPRYRAVMRDLLERLDRSPSHGFIIDRDAPEDPDE